MRLIEKYIFKNFLFPFIYTLILFALLFVIVDILGHLDEFIRSKVEPSLIIKYYLYSLPLILVQVLPFSALMAVIYSLGNLQKYNEITAIFSCGIGLFKIIGPYIVSGVCLTILVHTLNEKVNPYFFRTTHILKENFEKEKTKKNLIENVTLYGKDNKIIYARKYDIEKKILYNLVILEHDKNQILINKTTAKLAIWEGNKWKLYGIVSYNLDPEGNFVGEPKYFDDGEIDLKETPSEIIQHNIMVEAMSIEQLQSYIERFKYTSDKITRRLLVKLYQKMIIPFYVLIFIFIGLPFGFIQREINKFVCLGIAFFTGLMFYGLNAVVISLSIIGILPPLLSVGIVPLAFMSFSIILLLRSPH